MTEYQKSYLGVPLPRGLNAERLEKLLDAIEADFYNQCLSKTGYEIPMNLSRCKLAPFRG